MILSQNLVNTIAFSLLHSLWQIALIALLVFIINKIFAKKKSSIRYLNLFVGLVFMLFSFVATFALIDNNTQAQPLAINNETNLNLNPEIALEASSVNNEIAPVIIETVSIPQEIIERAPLSNFLKAKKLLLANLQYFVLFWLIGIAILSIRLLAQYIFAERYKYRHRKQADGKAQEIFLSLKAKLKIAEKVKLFESSIAKVPVVIGVFKPVVILPVSALSGLSGDMLEHILAHELAHIKRHDYLFNLLQTVIETLFFYHPAVWWISKQARLERENACDDIAIRACGSAAEYAETLIRLEHIRQEPKVAMAATNNLKERIMRILNIKQGRKQNPSGYLLSLLILVTIVGFLASQIFSQNVLAQESVEFKAKALIGDYEFYWLHLNKSASFNDKYELISLPEDAYLRLEQKLSKPERRLEIKNSENGLVYEYFEDGVSTEYDVQAKLWFADVIKTSLDYRNKFILEPNEFIVNEPNRKSSETHFWLTGNMAKNRIGSTTFGNIDHYEVGFFRITSPRQRLPEERFLIRKLADGYYGLEHRGDLFMPRPSLANSINSFLDTYEITPNIKSILSIMIAKIKDPVVQKEVQQYLSEKVLRDVPISNNIVPRNSVKARNNTFYTIFGNYAISKNAKVLTPTEPDGYILIQNLNYVASKSLIIANHDGEITKRYFENNIETKITDEADKWLTEANKDFLEAVLNEQSADSEEMIEKTVSEVEGSRNLGDAATAINYIAQPLSSNKSYEGLNLPFKTTKQLMEEENGRFFRLINSNYHIYSLLTSKAYSPFIKKTILDAIDYFSINNHTFQLIVEKLKLINDDELVAEALLALAPKLSKDKPEIMREFNALVDTIQNQTLREQIQKRLAAKQ